MTGQAEDDGICPECGDYLGEDSFCNCSEEDDFNDYLEGLEDPYLYEMSGEQETLVK